MASSGSERTADELGRAFPGVRVILADGDHPVTEVDAKEKTMSVDKGGEVWQFSTDGMKDLKAKKGDKVTVYYVAIAKKIEMK